MIEYFGAYEGSCIVNSIVGWGTEGIVSPSAFFSSPAVKVDVYKRQVLF